MVAVVAKLDVIGAGDFVEGGVRGEEVGVGTDIGRGGDAVVGAGNFSDFEGQVREVKITGVGGADEYEAGEVGLGFAGVAGGEHGTTGVAGEEPAGVGVGLDEFGDLGEDGVNEGICAGAA